MSLEIVAIPCSKKEAFNSDYNNYCEDFSWL